MRFRGSSSFLEPFLGVGRQSERRILLTTFRIRRWTSRPHTSGNVSSDRVSVTSSETVNSGRIGNLTPLLQPTLQTVTGSYVAVVFKAEIVIRATVWTLEAFAVAEKLPGVYMRMVRRGSVIHPMYLVSILPWAPTTLSSRVIQRRAYRITERESDREKKATWTNGIKSGLTQNTHGTPSKNRSVAQIVKKLIFIRK